MAGDERVSGCWWQSRRSRFVGCGGRGQYGEHAVYTVEYRSSEDSTIVDSGRRVNALPLVHGLSQPGEVHHLAAGAFHETTIPVSERVVTVMVTGRPEIPGCAIIGSPGYRPGRQVREPVTAEQFAQAVRDLLP